jgi:hypothetical protein
MIGQRKIEVILKTLEKLYFFRGLVIYFQYNFVPDRVEYRNEG